MVTLLTWNLRNLGTLYGSDADAATCETIRALLVAQTVQQAGANVLVIQEMRKRGIDSLRQIKIELNAIARKNQQAENWHFDWLPGSIANTGTIPPTQLSDLKFDPVANNEGYGVVYYDGALSKMTDAVSAGQDTCSLDGGAKDHFISIVSQGQPLDWTDNGDDIVVTFLSGPATGLGFPRSACANVNTARAALNSDIQSDDAIPQTKRSRRPCYVQLTGSGGQSVPAVVYHAPLGAQGSQSQFYGTLIGFASAQLQGLDAFYAGDFNVVRPGYLDSLTAYAGNKLGYKIQSTQSNQFMSSMVQASAQSQSKSVWLTGTGTRTSARDLGFGKQNAKIAVTDVLSWIADTSTGINKALQPRSDYVANKLLPRAAQRFLKLPDNAGDVVKSFFSGTIPSGADYDASTVRALMYNMIFSDHLPIQIVR